MFVALIVWIVLWIVIYKRYKKNKKEKLKALIRAQLNNLKTVSMLSSDPNEIERCMRLAVEYWEKLKQLEDSE